MKELSRNALGAGIIMLVLAILLLALTGCSDRIIEHGLRVGRAIAAEYTPERVAIGEAINEAIQYVQEAVDKHLAVHDELAYRLALSLHLSDAGLDQEQIDYILGEMFPVAAMARIGGRGIDYKSYVSAVYDGVTEDLE